MEIIKFSSFIYCNLPLSETHIYVILTYLYVFTQGSPKIVLLAAISQVELQWHSFLIRRSPVSPVEQFKSLTISCGHLQLIRAGIVKFNIQEKISVA